MTAPAPGPRADECVTFFHQHVGICQQAGYANGRRDAADETAALRAALDRVLDLCDDWEDLARGATHTTSAIREAARLP